MSKEWHEAVQKAFKVVFDSFERRMVQQGNNYVISIASYDSMKRILMGEYKE